MALSTIKKILLLAVVPTLSAACSYKYTSTFTVKNLASQTITVRYSSRDSNDEITEFTLEPGRLRNIFTDSEKCPENYIPMDTYADDQPLPPPNEIGMLEILVDGAKFPDDIRMRENWDYFSTDYAEKYTLNITDDMILYYLEDE